MIVPLIKKIIILNLVLFISILQISCKNSSSQRDIETSEQPVISSHEKIQLLGILDEQQELIEEMRNAANNDDKEFIKKLYEAILQLDQNFQQEFEMYEGSLSQSDSMDISKRHYEIIKSIPRYSSLMK